MICGFGRILNKYAKITVSADTVDLFTQKLLGIFELDGVFKDHKHTHGHGFVSLKGPLCSLPIPQPLSPNTKANLTHEHNSKQTPKTVF